MHLFLLFLYSTISRFWMLGAFPPLINKSYMWGRTLNAIESVGIIFLLYWYIQKKTKSSKLALLSAWVFSTLFWPFEQSRIISQANNATFVLLIFFIAGQEVQKIKKGILLVLFCVLLYFLYPTLWVFHPAKGASLSSTVLIKNVFMVFSAEHLFFKNIYFWWGGVRDFGIINLVFLPFFLIGLYKMISQKEWRLLIGILILGAITAVNPTFPEARELYLTTPFFAYIIALGLHKSSAQPSFLKLFIGIFLFLFFIYEQMQYFHYFTTHYYQDVKNNSSQIHEAF